MARLYLMPMIGTGTSWADRRVPKYRITHLAGLKYATMDYGPEDVVLVCVQQIPDATHDALVAEPDCVGIPANLDSQIGGNLNQVQNVIEALNIPSGWVQSTHTYRLVLRIVAAMFQFIQRYQALGGTKIFTGGITLNSTFISLSANNRTALINTADSLGYDRSGLTNATTLRVILKNMADQWRREQIFIGPEVL